jgi:hypothetical protein
MGLTAARERWQGDVWGRSKVDPRCRWRREVWCIVRVAVAGTAVGCGDGGNGNGNGARNRAEHRAQPAGNV